MSMVARLELRAPAGLRSRWSAEETLGGREETQSWTRRLTEGLARRLRVLREEGLEVMIIMGPGGSWVDCECDWIWGGGRV